MDNPLPINRWRSLGGLNCVLKQIMKKEKSYFVDIIILQTYTKHSKIEKNKTFFQIKEKLINVSQTVGLLAFLAILCHEK